MRQVRTAADPSAYGEAMKLTKAIPPSDVVLIVGTTARLTRLVVADTLGEWLIHDPLNTALDRYVARHPDDQKPWWWDWPMTLVSCPHCFSFHAAYLTLGSYHLARALGSQALAVWRFGAGVLTLSAVVGHINARIDEPIEDS